MLHKKGKAPTGRTHPTAQKIFGAIVVVFLVLFTIGGIRSCNQETAETERLEAERKRKAATTTPTRSIVPVERPWTSRTFEVPEKGLRLWLEPGSARYPKLGGIKTHTSSGVIYVDLPGVNHNGMNNPAGWFTFFPDPPGSERKIEIYNRW